MATFNGRNARVTVNADTTEAIVGEMINWAIDTSMESIDTTSFGDAWSKGDVGLKKWSGSMEGHCDPEDTNGQDVLEAAFLNGTLVQDIRFYVKYSTTSGQKIHYVKPDTATDSNAGVRITAFNRKVDQSGVAMLTANFEGNGPYITVEETIV